MNVAPVAFEIRVHAGEWTFHGLHSNRLPSFHPFAGGTVSGLTAPSRPQLHRGAERFEFLREPVNGMREDYAAQQLREGV